MNTLTEPESPTNEAQQVLAGLTEKTPELLLAIAQEAQKAVVDELAQAESPADSARQLLAGLIDAPPSFLQMVGEEAHKMALEAVPRPSMEEQLASAQVILERFIGGHYAPYITDYCFKPNRVPWAKINCEWRPHPDFPKHAITPEDFDNLVSAIYLVDQEYPIDHSKLSAQAFVEAVAKKGDFVFNAVLDDNSPERASPFRFRAHLANKYGKVELDIRVLPETISSLDELGFSESLAPQLFEQRDGLIIVSGPMGSGKSTTLAAMIREYLNFYPCSKIGTLEDPVEYRLDVLGDTGIYSQCHVGKDVTGWFEGIFEAKREQASLVMLGELREPEAIQAAVELASSGLMVIASCHHNEPQQALDYILQAHSEKSREYVLRKLSKFLRAIVIQELVPSIAKDPDTARAKLIYQAVLNRNVKVANSIAKGNLAEIRISDVDDSGNRLHYGFTDRLDVLSRKGLISAATRERHLSRDTFI